jgi:hypothetical protein
MTEPSFKLPLNPRIRNFLGLLVGIVFGPTIAFILVHVPSNELLGPHPGPYIGLCISWCLVIGLCYGTIVGLVVALFVWILQKWFLAKRGKGRTPNLQWPDTNPVDMLAQRHSTVTDRGTSDADDRITRRTDIT